MTETPEPDIPDVEPADESPTSAPQEMRGAHAGKRTEKQVHQPTALRYRMQGLTYPEVARKLEEEHGLERSPSTLRNWVQDALKRFATQREEYTQEMVEMQRQRLMRQMRELEANLARIEQELNETEIGDAEPSMLRERRQTVNAMRKVNESLRKLFGYNAPEKREVTHEHDVEMKMELPSPEPAEELEEGEAEAIEAKAELLEEGE